MTSTNLIVDDSSPLITYAPAGAWVDTPKGDALVTNYRGQSFHTTQAPGARATFTFNGTALTIYGAKRPGYGTYQLHVDGSLVSTGSSGQKASATQQVLASAMDLGDGQHTAVLTSTGGGPLDIDYLEYSGTVGPAGSTVSTKTYDDFDSAIQYLPSPSKWFVLESSAFLQNTLHYSNSSDTSAALSFTGDAIALYGTVSPNHANIQVTIDGKTQLLGGGGNGQVSELRTQVLLYFANNLGPGNHQVIVSASGNEATGRLFDLDRISVFSASEAPVKGDPSIGAVQTEIPRPAISSGAAVGAVIGGILAVVIILGIIFLCFRRKLPKLIKKRAGAEPLSPKSPNLPMQQAPDMEEGRSRFPPDMQFLLSPPVARIQSRSRVSVSSLAPSYYFVDQDALQRAPTVKAVGRSKAMGSSTSSASKTLISGSVRKSVKAVPARPKRPPTLHMAGVKLGWV